MKTAAIQLALLSLLVCQPAHAESFKLKAVHAARKAIMLPVYMCGGAVVGVIAWRYFGGKEAELKQMVKGLKWLK